MKILKYKFTIPNLVVDDGELLQVGETEETYTFTLLFKGLDLYKKITGRELLNDLNKCRDVENIDFNIIKDMAKASYVKIDGDNFHQNLATADEFSKTKVFSTSLYSPWKESKV